MSGKLFNSLSTLHQIQIQSSKNLEKPPKMKIQLATTLCVLLLVGLIAESLADKGCPGNPTECKQHCTDRGNRDGKCEKRWYRWRYRSRCKCNPCEGKLVLGACITSIPSVGVQCDLNGENCKPTG